MKTWKHFTRIFAALAVWISLCQSGIGQTASRLSTSFLARGEQASLEVTVVGGEPNELPEIPAIDQVQIQPMGIGSQTRILPGRKIEHVFEYRIFSYKPGNFVIPPISVMVDGVKTFTEPVNFVVFNPDELRWSEVQAGGRTIRYASSFRTLKDKPFENETLPTEIKIYVPRDIFIEDWGIPDFERDGVAAWRFQPTPVRSTINLNGVPCFAVAYPSTITPTRTGKVGIGPAKIRLTSREVVMDPFSRQVYPEFYLQVPKLEMDAVPLPAGAPEGFENAVGSFRIAASISTSDVQEGEPISVDLIVSGSGNLDTMRPPALADTDGWKVYSTTTEPRGDERRHLSGSVIFHQLILPQELKSEIPTFRLVYFDPADETYKTVTTEPIALQMSPNTSRPAAATAAAVQSLPVPFERMTEILGVLRTAQLTLPASPVLPAWFGHALGTLAALVLIAKALWMRFAPRLRKDPVRETRARELREIEKARSAGDTDFLKSTGGFIERWLGGNSDPEIRAVLAERDAVCFRAEQPKAVLDQKRRDQILRLLRKTALVLVFLTTLGLPTSARADNLATQAIEAYQAAKYDDAIKLWLEAGKYDQLTADTLYNIGNASYRSGSPGYAALFFRRALTRDSGHQEALQNLRFIERKYGAITVQRPEYQYALARFPLSTWKAVCWTGLWLCGLALLVFPATRPGARLRIAAVGALVIAPILISIGVLGWRYFPNDAEFAPVDRQAVIISENVVLHTDAARTSPEVIDAPPGSLCEVISESGRWAYVAFATKTRGWVPIESIERVIPEKPPAPPKFRKPKADGKTA